VYHPKLFPTILKVETIDGCTKKFIMTITVVFKFMRSQTLPEFEVCAYEKDKINNWVEI
jgi:hypothetical protein